MGDAPGRAAGSRSRPWNDGYTVYGKFRCRGVGVAKCVVE